MWHAVTTLLSVFLPVCTFISSSNVHLGPKDAHWCGTVKIKYLFCFSTAHIKCTLKWYLNRWSFTILVASSFQSVYSLCCYVFDEKLVLCSDLRPENFNEQRRASLCGVYRKQYVCFGRISAESQLKSDARVRRKTNKKSPERRQIRTTDKQVG